MARVEIKVYSRLEVIQGLRFSALLSNHTCRQTSLDAVACGWKFCFFSKLQSKIDLSRSINWHKWDFDNCMYHLTTIMATNQTDFPTPVPTTDPMLLEYEIMDVNLWTKIIVTIPFAMCCFFGVLLIVFHKMKSNHERQQIHPVKPVEV